MCTDAGSLADCFVTATGDNLLDTLAAALDGSEEAAADVEIRPFPPPSVPPDGRELPSRLADALGRQAAAIELTEEDRKPRAQLVFSSWYATLLKNECRKKSSPTVHIEFRT